MADEVSNSGESLDMSSSYILSELIAKNAEVLSKSSVSNQTIDTATAPVGINYTLWSQVVEMYILGKDKLGVLMVICLNLHHLIRASANGAQMMLLRKAS